MTNTTMEIQNELAREAAAELETILDNPHRQAVYDPEKLYRFMYAVQEGGDATQCSTI